MNLRDLLHNIDDYADHLVIYASPKPRWSAASPVRVTAEPADGSLPRDAVGFTYLMEVVRAKRVLTVWRHCRAGAVPTGDDMCEAVVYFARHDAHLPAFEAAV